MERSRKNSFISLSQKMRPERVFALGFLLLILLGSALLCLPAATVDAGGLSYFDSLFTATSAVCVTGLVAVDTGTTFTAFGQGVLLMLIQIGGLGFMVFTTMLMSLFGRRISLQGRVLIRESMNGTSYQGLLRLTYTYVLIALIVELTGALLLSFRFIPMFGPMKGIWFSVFHAISAFCNAGFDLFGGFSSLTMFRNDAWVLMVISLLIILGGIGFIVIFEVIEAKGRWHGLSLHTRIVLIFSGALLGFGMLCFALLEWNNTATLAQNNAGIGERLLGSFFQSVTMRTAGFNSVDLASMRSVTKLICVMLMFVGASPASTGGGVKTTTVFVLLLTVWSVLSNRKDLVLFKKRLPDDSGRRALAIITISFALVVLCTVALSCIEQEGQSMIDLLFESASSIATVGVSAVGSPNLHPASRLVLIPAMYLGRVGPMTIATALARQAGKADKMIRYPEETIIIG